jgi:hypothetical protein
MTAKVSVKCPIFNFTNICAERIELFRVDGRMERRNLVAAVFI